MIRGAWLLPLLVACGSSSDKAPPPPPHPVAIDAGVRVPIVSPECRAAIHAGSATALDARVAVLLQACEVCGPWKPLLTWRQPHEQGGPTRNDISDAMVACAAYCNTDAKDRFLGTLDDARGAHSRTPWRWLFDTCKAAVSAVPDSRYSSATMFALDRIGRAVGSGGGSDADALAKLDVPLPALSISSVGPQLPRSTAVEATAPRAQITITGNDVRVGTLPIGHLTAAGVVTDYGADVYPGALAQLGRGGGSGGAGSGAPIPDQDLVLLAPEQLPATRVAEVVTKLRVTHRVLLAAAIDGPDAWELVGTIGVSLVDPDAHGAAAQTIALTGKLTAEVTADPAKPVLVIAGGDATVADLSDLLTKLHALGVKQITLHAGRAAAQ